jgi:hypothetical protein
VRLGVDWVCIKIEILVKVFTFGLMLFDNSFDVGVLPNDLGVYPKLVLIYCLSSSPSSKTSLMISCSSSPSSCRCSIS